MEGEGGEGVEGGLGFGEESERVVCEQFGMVGWGGMGWAGVGWGGVGVRGKGRGWGEEGEGGGQSQPHCDTKLKMCVLPMAVIMGRAFRFKKKWKMMFTTMLTNHYYVTLH